MTNDPNHFYVFGPFRVDPVQRLILREGMPVPLKPKAFDLLCVLINRPGRVIGKEELMQEIWPDSFVEENNLADNIYKLRKALGDGENGCRYIETVPKHGYRFVADVTQRENGAGLVAMPPVVRSTRDVPGSGDSRVANLAAGTALPRSANYRRQRLTSLAFGVILLLFLAAVVWIAFWKKGSAPASALRVVPVTNLPGFIGWPSLSPDGKQVAFVWEKEPRRGMHVFVKLVDAGDPLQLTFGPGNETNSVWSADGRYIAFIRSASVAQTSTPDPPAIYVVPALGGSALKVAEAYGGGGRSLDWSPDGKWFAVIDSKLRQHGFITDSPQDPSSIFLIRKDTGERRQLTSPPPNTVGDRGLAISPNGKTIAFVRQAGLHVNDVYIVPFEGGEPKRLTFDRGEIADLTWTPDSREIVFSSRRGGMSGLWSVSISGDYLKPFAAIGQGAVCPSISRVRNSLVYLQDSDLDVWRIELDGPNRTALSPTQFLSSRHPEASARYSPDGKKIVLASGRTGSAQIWVCNSDGSHLLQVQARRAGLQQARRSRLAQLRPAALTFTS